MDYEKEPWPLPSPEEVMAACCLVVKELNCVVREDAALPGGGVLPCFMYETDFLDVHVVSGLFLDVSLDRAVLAGDMALRGLSLYEVVRGVVKESLSDGLTDEYPVALMRLMDYARK